MYRIIETLKGIAIVTMIIFLIGIVGGIETHYTRQAIVTRIENNNTIILEDETGNEWAFDTDKYAIGDTVKMTMHTNGTDSNIYDDKIVKIKK